MKACQHSDWVSLRIDRNGVLQVQHLLTINVAEGSQINIFLTFFVNPDNDPEDDADSTLNSTPSSIMSTQNTISTAQ